jgi:hypothetical protein
MIGFDLLLAASFSAPLAGLTSADSTASGLLLATSATFVASAAGFGAARAQARGSACAWRRTPRSSRLSGRQPLKAPPLTGAMEHGQTHPLGCPAFSGRVFEFIAADAMKGLIFLSSPLRLHRLGQRRPRGLGAAAPRCAPRSRARGCAVSTCLSRSCTRPLISATFCAVTARASVSWRFVAAIVSVSCALVAVCLDELALRLAVLPHLLLPVLNLSSRPACLERLAWPAAELLLQALDHHLRLRRDVAPSSICDSGFAAARRSATMSEPGSPSAHDDVVGHLRDLLAERRAEQLHQVRDGSWRREL